MQSQAKISVTLPQTVCTLVLLVSVALVLASGLAAQARVAAPVALVPYTLPKLGITPIPPQLTLSSSSGAPGGQVWLRETDGGIVVQMRIDTPIYAGAGDWAGFPLEMNSKPYVAIWLASAATVPMPQIGWGNQFGMLTCATYRPGRFNRPTLACDAWAKLQRQYRAQLRRLFTRKWVLTPQMSRETYATAAYRQVLLYSTNADAAMFAGLKPKGTPRSDPNDEFFQWTTGGPSSTAYSNTKTTIQEFQLPWSLFPPADELALSHFRINVRFCARRGVCSSTAPLAQPDDPATWNRLRLARPHTSHITPCQYPLQAHDVVGNVSPGWYFPTSGPSITTEFGLGNLVQGYLYDPGGLSPQLIRNNFFDRTVAPGQTICGPQLTWLSNGNRYDSTFTVDPATLSLHSMPSGTTLIRSGPTEGMFSALGAGPGGADPVESFSIYALVPNRGIVPLIRTGFDLGFQSAAIQVSPDWKTVTVYQNGPDEEDPLQTYTKGWFYKRSCWDGHAYQPCGSGPGAPPKGVRILTVN